MQGKVAIVTGAAFGIGRATAIAFAREGARVVVADWKQDDTTVNEIKALGGEAIFVPCDVSRSADVQALVKKTMDTYGRLDYAFNNAGIEGVQGATADCTEENWARTIAINLTGAFLCMKYQIPEMLKSGGGVIVNCSSVAGLVGFPGLPAYVASKHGLNGLTKTAALEYAQEGIRINSVCPGVIRTEMIDRITGKDPETEKQFESMEPMGRMGEPREIADAVVWLCSEGASFVTGHTLTVDGGFVAR